MKESNFWSTELIRLRSCSENDLEAYLKGDKDTEAIRVFEGQILPPKSPDSLREWLKEMATQDGKYSLSFTVESADGEVAGYCNIRDWKNTDGTFSFGVRIFKSHQRKGYASEVSRLLLRYGFYELRCQKANSATVSINTASIEMHHKLGFQDEGCIRRSVYTNGQYCDELLFGITIEEFMEMESKSS